MWNFYEHLWVTVLAKWLNFNTQASRQAEAVWRDANARKKD